MVVLSFKAFIYIFSDENARFESQLGFLEGSLASPLADILDWDLLIPGVCRRSGRSPGRFSVRCFFPSAYQPQHHRPAAISRRQREQDAEISVISVCLGRLRGFM